MTRPKARKKTSVDAPADVSTCPSGFRVLRAFHHQENDGSFGFARFYWVDGLGYRQSMLSNFRKKRRPVSGSGDEDTAARVEVLLPADAAEEYTDIDFLVRRYQEKLPDDESTAYAQVTLRFPDAANAHHPYEVARQWIRSFYVDRPEVGVPVVLVLHAPHLAGSASPVHAHALVLPRRLNRFGWSTMMAELAYDEGEKAARTAWLAKS
jgi:hypothetical protein